MARDRTRFKSARTAWQGYGQSGDGAQRKARVASDMRAVLAALLERKIKDPRVGSATITGVKLADDLTSATIYVTGPGTPAERNDTLAGLESAAGFLRGEVGRRLRLKRAPALLFQHDRSLDDGARIDALLQSLRETKE